MARPVQNSCVYRTAYRAGSPAPVARDPARDRHGDSRISPLPRHALSWRIRPFWSHAAAARRDAVVASARLVLELDALWTAVQQAGEDLTVTFGEFGTDPGAHSFSKIAGETRLCLDCQPEPRDAGTHARRGRESGRIISAVCGVSFELGP